MRDDIRLGRIAGFPLAMNWSVLVVVWLLTWGLADVVLPDAAPGLHPRTYWLAALAGALSFFASLLAHELAHAIVARRWGVEVEGITLWLFGGVARLAGEARTPQAEFRIAAVGPAVSLALAASFALAALGFDALGAPAVVSAVPAWLARINLVLAVFNLIPGAPLDGGRILRAVLWRRRGDRERASVTAARAGRALGFALIVVGLLEFLAGANLGGLWTVFIGWFLLGAARAEEVHALTSGALGDVRVGEVMSPGPQVAPGWLSLPDFLENHVMRSRFSAFPVESFDGRVVGMVTLAHLRAVPPEERPRTRVGDVACPLDRLTIAHPDDLLITLLQRPSPQTGNRSLVFEGSRLVGIVTPTDIARAVERGALARSASVLR